MTGGELRTVADFEKNLKAGDLVVVRWTGCHAYFHARGSVKRVNGKSIRVLLEGPARDEVVVPNLLAGTWSANNRVEPVGGYVWPDQKPAAPSPSPAKVRHVIVLSLEGTAAEVDAVAAKYADVDSAPVYRGGKAIDSRWLADDGSDKRYLDGVLDWAGKGAKS